MAASRLRSTAISDLTLMLAERCDISGYIISNHAPRKAVKFSGNRSFGYIGSLIIMQHHTIVTAPQTFIRFIRIRDDLRVVSLLPRFKCLGFKPDCTPRIGWEASTSSILTWRFPALVILSLVWSSPLESSPGVRPMEDAKCCAEAKRLKSPASVSTPRAVTVLTPRKQLSLWTFSL